MRHRWASILVLLSLSGVEATVSAQAAPERRAEDELESPEEPDPTRLDVERLPPEAIRVTRDFYAHGFFLEAHLGGRGFVGGVGDVTDGGPWFSVAVGYEILEWLHALIAAEGSFHNTSGPAPPRRTALEVVGGSASIRLQANVTEAVALWLSASVGVVTVTTDVLELYGFLESADPGITYGGDVGIDWHLRSRHISLGLAGGVRHFPTLEAGLQSMPTIGVNGSAYLRYVF